MGRQAWVQCVCCCYHFAVHLASTDNRRGVLRSPWEKETVALPSSVVSLSLPGFHWEWQDVSVMQWIGSSGRRWGSPHTPSQTTPCLGLRCVNYSERASHACCMKFLDQCSAGVVQCADSSQPHWWKPGGLPTVLLAFPGVVGELLTVPSPLHHSPPMHLLGTAVVRSLWLPCHCLGLTCLSLLPSAASAWYLCVVEMEQ